MANRPALLLGDEPTSALDVSCQKEVMEHLVAFQQKFHTTIFLVTHNMSIVSRYADTVGVMCQGILVEWGTREEILKKPRHPYTRMLLNSVPRLNGGRLRGENPFIFSPPPRLCRHSLSATHWYLEWEDDYAPSLKN